MAVPPVIFDDGGSTRIKRLVPNGFGAMNGLLDVDENQNPPQSSETVAGPFTNIKVVTIDANGNSAPQLNSPINPNDTFTITSSNGQTTVGTLDNTSRCVIQVQGVANNAPLVEAKQFQKKRRYVVANAGPIQQITGNINGGNVAINTAGNLYTTLILT